MLVIADRCGRLGNRLWTFANAVAWGMEHGCPVLNPGLAEHASDFPGLVRRSRCPGWVPAGRLARGFAWVVPPSAWALLYRADLRLRFWPHLALADGEFLDLDSEPVSRRLASAPVAFLTGLYHLAPISLGRHARDIRMFLRPAETHCRQAERVVAAARAVADIVVGVHIRQGDYRTYCDGIMFYTTAEYADLMRQLVALWPGRRIAFVVCSDEPQPEGAFAGLNAHTGPGLPVADFHALALCDYIVGPSSTFSRWASFWGDRPLWRLDWKAEERYHADRVTRCPTLTDFAVCLTPTHLVDEGRVRRAGTPAC